MHNPVDITVDNFVDNWQLHSDHDDVTVLYIQGRRGLGPPADSCVSRETWQVAVFGENLAPKASFSRIVGSLFTIGRQFRPSGSFRDFGSL